MDQFSSLVNFSEPALLPALLIIPYCPTAWNILARLEYRFHVLTKIACGNKYVGCYALAAYIFSSSAYRDYL
jgi:phosphatidylethanolamine N-methyltransferase